MRTAATGPRQQKAMAGAGLAVVLSILPALTLAAGSAAAAKAQRIASINLCTDQLLLLLVDRSRIVTVSQLAADPDYSCLWREARGIPANTGLAEQIIPLQPDLVLGNEYTSRSSQALLRRLGHPVRNIQLPETLAGIDDFIRQVGYLVGEQRQADGLIAAMHRRLAALGTHALHPGSPAALIYAPNGHTEGAGTFKHDLLSRAGLRNAAAESGINRDGTMTVEQVLAAGPDVLVIDDSARNRDSLAQHITAHPALASLAQTRRVVIPSNRWLCPGPWSLDAVALLAGATP